MVFPLYVFDAEIGNFHYGPGHPMKPHRIALTHSLVRSFGLDCHLQIIQPIIPENDAFLSKFHPPGYLDQIEKKNKWKEYGGQELSSEDLNYCGVICNNFEKPILEKHPESIDKNLEIDRPKSGQFHDRKSGNKKSKKTYKQETNYNTQDESPQRIKGKFNLKNPIGEKGEENPLKSFGFPPHEKGILEDCPCFMGMREYAIRYAAGSIVAANGLKSADIAIHWGGGLHHAKKYESSGFCYTNDIVLAILELLKFNERVLYIDIDIHHGDGVEEAFYSSDRVLTVSLHRFGDFFPNTGALFCNGTGSSKGFSINVPLKQGITDAEYIYIFRRVIGASVYAFKPSVIVLQCGADSLAGDRLGCFNLSIRGHGECVRYVKNFGIKMLCLGGGGYTPKNVARLWTYETSILAGVPIQQDIPKSNQYFDYFDPDYCLHPSLVERFSNENTREYIDSVVSYTLESLSYLC